MPADRSKGIRATFKSVADSLDFDVQDLGRLLKDTICRSTITSLAIDEPFNAVRNRLMKYAQTRSVYLKLKRPGSIHIVAASEGQLKYKEKMRRIGTKFHRTRPPPPSAGHRPC